MPRSACRAPVGRVRPAGRPLATPAGRRLRRVQRCPARTALPVGHAALAVVRHRAIRARPQQRQLERGLPAAPRHTVVRHHGQRPEHSFSDHRRCAFVAGGNQRGITAGQRRNPGADRSGPGPLGLAPGVAMPGRKPVVDAGNRLAAGTSGGVTDHQRRALRPAGRARHRGPGRCAGQRAGVAEGLATDRRLRQ
ncbi:hypothetical protein D3C78_1337460 [compost metagenome]